MYGFFKPSLIELFVGLRLDIIGHRPDRIMRSDGMISVFDFLILCMVF